MQNFNEIISLYRDSYNKFGDSPKSLLTPKGKHDLRFSAIKNYAHKGKSILLTVKPGWLNTSLVNNVPSSRCVDLEHVCKAMIFQFEMAVQSVSGSFYDISVMPLLLEENS